MLTYPIRTLRFSGAPHHTLERNAGASAHRQNGGGLRASLEDLRRFARSRFLNVLHVRLRFARSQTTTAAQPGTASLSISFTEASPFAPGRASACQVSRPFPGFDRLQAKRPHL